MASPSAFPSLSPMLRRSVALTKISLPIRKPSTFRRNPTLLPIKALKEWREYEDALREKDLARALRFLRSMELEPLPAEESSVDSVSYVPADYPRTARDWEVLDACLNADDMRLVGSAYSFLQDRGFLPNFGKFKNIGILKISSKLLFLYICTCSSFMKLFDLSNYNEFLLL